MPILENSVFYSKHKERSSVIDKSIFGKIFLLSAFDDELKKNQFADYIELFSDKSKKVNYFLENLKNPFLKYNLFSDYQVIAQYQIKNKLNFEEKEILEKFEDNENEILYVLVKENPIIFLRHTLYNYFSLWMPGGKQIFLQHLNYEIPLLDLLKKSQGPINYQNSLFLFFGLAFFTCLFVIFLFINIIFIFKFFKYPHNREESNLLLFLIPNIYLIFISVVNVATPRYLMPIYPMILLFIALELRKLKTDRYDF